MSAIIYYGLRFLALLIILIVIYLLAAFLLPMISVDAEPVTDTKNKTAYLDGNGVHVDLIFPAVELDPGFLDSITVSPDTKYVAFGWGDQGFYLNTPTWGELKFSTAFVAAFLKSPTAMHLTDHFSTQDDWRVLSLTETQQQELLDYLKTGFARDESGRIRLIPDAGYGEHDRFYHGTGHYHAFNTCNTWVNNGLKKIGLRTAIWAVQEDGILRYFPKLGEATPEDPR
ncbi:TIGR02117 family protein [Lewinellaceae bacterium SD302]|nr:TIGR02117 family protein [Lewinellaceae bacterium SD302]